MAQIMNTTAAIPTRVSLLTASANGMFISFLLKRNRKDDIENSRNHRYNCHRPSSALGHKIHDISYPTSPVR